MRDDEGVRFLQWALPRLGMRWPGFRKVRRQVIRRIRRRMAELQLARLDEYRAYLETHGAEWQALDAYCRITISRFYRDRGVFDTLRRDVLPPLVEQILARDERQLRAWSAGCASGEEPYTLALVEQFDLRPRYPQVELRITATDADPWMLERARAACYRSSSLKDLPPQWRETAFRPCVAEVLQLRQSFRGTVRWAQQDIREEIPPGPFHLILCRHLAFTYFDDPGQARILRQLIERLAPGGILVTGKQESLPEASRGRLEDLDGIGIYRLPERTPTGRAGA